GVAFWDPESVNPTAAIVTETGMVAFSQLKPFYSWSDILGLTWVRQFEEDRFGAPLAHFHFDGRCYWSKDPSGIWRSASKEDTRHKIADNFSLSMAPDARGALSEVDTVLLKVRETKVVDRAYPVLYSDKDISRMGAITVLNTSRLKPIAPHDKPVVW